MHITNSASMTYVPALVLCWALRFTKSIACTPAAAAGRYERGSKINRTRHVLDLRHVVERLSALK